MAMNRKKRLLLTGFMLLVVVLPVWLFRPYPEIDETRVHPSLRGLDDSTTCAWTSVADGGSLFIQIERPDGGIVDLTMSNSLDHSFLERGQLYIGAGHLSMEGSAKITGYDHTKFVVAKLFAKDPGLTEDIPLLTKRTADWIKFMAKEGPLEVWEALRFVE